MTHVSDISKTLLTALTTLLLGLLVGATMSLARDPELADLWNAPTVRWHDVPTGIRESSSTGRPVIMVFHASWCSSCKRYREVWRDPGVVAASKSFVMILVDVDKNPDINGAFAPDGTYVPRTLFLSAEGDVLSQYHGKDADFPHTIDIDSPTELRTLMSRAAVELGVEPPPTEPQSPDRRAEAR